jgi:hypothetical protein
VGIPGTGLSFREQLFKTSSGRKNRISESDLIELNEILNIHLHTPAPDAPWQPDFSDGQLTPPVKPSFTGNTGCSIVLVLLLFVFPLIPLVLSFKVNNWLKANKQYDAEMEQYKAAKKIQDEKWEKFNALMSNPVKNAEDILTLAMENLDWPKETLVAYEVDKENEEESVARFDVDLPEIEDMPDDVSNKAMRLNYVRHIFGIGFRIIGEAFRALPFLRNVVLSGYSQRVDSATGNTTDEYLYSVRVPRERWERINFNNLENVDPLVALNAFEMRCDMTKTGIMHAIEPF